MDRFKVILLKSIKIALGSLLAIALANRLGLLYAPSAGIITILSVLNTKKSTFLVGGKRLIAFIIAVIIAKFSFSVLGYNSEAFILFLLIFSGICYLFNIEEGIPMNSVLVTHFWIENSMSIPLIRNEALLCAIGIVCGILVNLYMPSKLKEIDENKSYIETQIKDILDKLAEIIDNPKVEEALSEEILKLSLYLKESIKTACDTAQNTITQDMSYFVNYSSMREEQLSILMYIYKSSKRLYLVPQQAKIISDFIRTISRRYSEYNNSMQLLEELGIIKKEMEEETLPGSRYEFENRAVLFHILYLLEEFLNIKKRFVSELDDKTIKRFWSR